MFFDFFKRRGGYVDVEVKDGKGVISKKNRWLIFVIIAAIFILAFGGSGSRDKKEKEILIIGVEMPLGCVPRGFFCYICFYV